MKTKNSGIKQYLALSTKKIFYVWLIMVFFKAPLTAQKHIILTILPAKLSSAKRWSIYLSLTIARFAPQ